MLKRRRTKKQRAAARARAKNRRETEAFMERYDSRKEQAKRHKQIKLKRMAATLEKRRRSFMRKQEERASEMATAVTEQKTA